MHTASGDIWYDESNIYSSVLPSIKSKLNQVVGTGNIKIVYKETELAAGLTYISSDLFLFSANELGITPLLAPSDEGTQYPIFTDDNSRIKNYSNASGSASSPDSYWLRSHVNLEDIGFCRITKTGSLDYTSQRDTLGLVFGFCI